MLAAAFSMSFAQTASAAPAGGGHWDDLGSHEAYYQSEYRTTEDDPNMMRVHYYD
ncbi:hypothetical protein HMPREF1211_05125 [Streptomyces sp. HGB0020]|nr:hypothetical protein HMPREF1211_05125 [Streptomyces sp. HGB0020]